MCHGQRLLISQHRSTRPQPAHPPTSEYIAVNLWWSELVAQVLRKIYSREHPHHTLRNVSHDMMFLLPQQRFNDLQQLARLCVSARRSVVLVLDGEGMVGDGCISGLQRDQHRMCEYRGNSCAYNSQYVGSIALGKVHQRCAFSCGVMGRSSGNTAVDAIPV